tara:strand:- start:5491 stop:6264 length:774 start_codon:yes stop_codon:yes gene_type:complete
MEFLKVENLKVSVGEKQVLKGVDIEVKKGEVHAIMGPNGSGKSTLAYSLMGHPLYELDSGNVFLDGENIIEMEPHEKAQKGLFLAFQYPMEIPGLQMESFLRSAVASVKGKEETKDAFEFHRKVLKEMRYLGIDESFATRYLNDGFSGGEKKRAEVLQMLLLEPTMAILDETDSGLDIDAIKIVAKGVNRLKEKGMSILIITHYQRILDYIHPDRVSVLSDGRILKTSGPELAKELEKTGYKNFSNQKDSSDLDVNF